MAPSKQECRREGEEGSSGGSIEQLSEIEPSFWRRLSRRPMHGRGGHRREFLGINYGEITEGRLRDLIRPDVREKEIARITRQRIRAFKEPGGHERWEIMQSP